MPLFTSADGLGVKLVIGDGSGAAYVLCHPESDGPPDTSTSVLFHVETPDTISLVRVWDVEVVSIAFCDSALYAIDNRQNLNILEEGDWRVVDSSSSKGLRINDLRCVENKLFGICNHGAILVLEGENWSLLTEIVRDRYLYDVAIWQNETLISGEDGFVAILEEAKTKSLDVPVDADLTCILPLGDRFLVTGWSATAFLMDLEEVTFLNSNERDLDFLNAVKWQDRVLIAASTEILELEDNDLRVFSSNSATLLAVSGNRLWKQGYDGLSYTDGSGNWTDVPLSITL